MDIFFEVYPDGRLISLIRDPKNWFPSALRHGPKFYGDIKLAILQWNESAQAMLRNKELYGDRIRLLKFEDLVGDTEAVMRYLQNFSISNLKISWWYRPSTNLRLKHIQVLK